jgi:penicillin-insensitive murein endopeptidase
VIRFLGAFIATITMVSAAAAPASQCYGSPGRGSLAQGVRLPIGGDNFGAYSTVAVAAGRTYMHSTSAKIVIDTYARLASALPLARFVYGETGLQSGGPIAPHRTHQNGLSIDFFAPVRDASGKAAVLPTQMQSRFGYDIEFNIKGQYQQYQIDFPALAEHLYQLHGSAKQNGAGIERVIIDTAFLPQLFATPRGPWLKANLPFMMEKPWVRHDEHYHVDFSLPCRRP